MAMAIFERLKSRRRESEQRQNQSWQQLIDRVASDQADESEIETTLQALGRTEKQLQDAVVLVMKRQDFEPLVAEIPNLHQQLADIGVARAAMETDVTQRMRELTRYQTDEREMFRRQEVVITEKLNRANDAAAWLCEHVPEDVKRRAGAVYAQIQTRRDEVNRLRNYAAEQRSNGRDRLMTDNGAGKARVAELESEIVKLLAEADRIESGAV